MKICSSDGIYYLSRDDSKYKWRLEKWSYLITQEVMVNYLLESDGNRICDLLEHHPELLLKIRKDQRKAYIEIVLKRKPIIFSELDDDEKTLKLCELAVNTAPRLIRDVPESIKTNEFILRMIDKNGYVIDDIENQTDEMCFRAVKSNPYAIYGIKNPTEEMWLIAIKNGDGIIFSKDNPSEEMMSIALKTQGLYNSWRKMPQYYRAVLAYMKKYGSSLKHIKRKFKTYEVCRAAIESSPYAIKFVNKSTLKKHPDLLDITKNKWGK